MKPRIPIVTLNVLLLTFMFFAVCILVESTYTLVTKHDGVCFSYQCVPPVGSSILVVLITAVIVAFNLISGYYIAKNTYKEFRR